MRITYANSKVEKYFSDFNRLRSALPADWVRTIKKHLDRLEAAGYPVVFHIHDEVVIDAGPDKADLDDVIRIMSQVPSWAEGLPLNADGWVNDFFKKD